MMMTPMPSQRCGVDLFAEQPPGQRRVDDIADREHRVGDAHLDPRQRDDPDHHADRVAGQAAEDAGMQRQSGRAAPERGAAVAHRDLADAARPGLEQQLRCGVEQHAGQHPRKIEKLHCSGYHHASLVLEDDPHRKAALVQLDEARKVHVGRGLRQRLPAGGELVERVDRAARVPAAAPWRIRPGSRPARPRAQVEGQRLVVDSGPRTRAPRTPARGCSADTKGAALLSWP